MNPSDRDWPCITQNIQLEVLGSLLISLLLLHRMNKTQTQCYTRKSDRAICWFIHLFGSKTLVHLKPSLFKTKPMLNWLSQKELLPIVLRGAYFPCMVTRETERSAKSSKRKVLLLDAFKDPLQTSKGSSNERRSTMINRRKKGYSLFGCEKPWPFHFKIDKLNYFHTTTLVFEVSKKFYMLMKV